MSLFCATNQERPYEQFLHNWTRTAKKPIGLNWQNNNFARASRFLNISLQSMHDYHVKVTHFSRFVEDVNTRQRLSFSFPELWYSSLELNSKKICQQLTNRTSWNKRDNVTFT